MNLLFVCSRNRLRSPTAEAVFSALPHLEVTSAGTNPDAETPVSREMIEDADIIFVMERSHQKKLLNSFKSLLKTKRIVVLNIPDNYEYMDAELVQILRVKVAQYVSLQATAAFRS